ncbi:hypothetical protein [Peribacillus simplex]|uniref:hypothetical protein n=1 Tax=Peribacillus simplex TaxID=1478 RepID=UPI0024C1EB2D|nr:hypothetical protein [Peribacillus simplex]WHY98835.1 hypothetical protein QNH37_06620 [Peribacillus simplex]
MATQDYIYSLDEYIETINGAFLNKQKEPFERLASKLISTLVHNYKITSHNYPAIDGYWKPKNPREILKFDTNMQPVEGWVLFSMKTSTNKKRCVNLLKESMSDAKKRAKEIINTDNFSWIGVTNVSLSPAQTEDVINYGRSQGIKNCGLFFTFSLGNNFIKSREDAELIAYELGFRFPEHKYKYKELSPGIAALEIMRELNNLWNNHYDESNIKRTFLLINEYFERRFGKVSTLINESVVSEKCLNTSMLLDWGDDVFVYYLAGEKLCERHIEDLTIHKYVEIGQVENLIGEEERIGNFIIVRDLSVVFCFYRYIFRYFFPHPLTIVVSKDITIKSNPTRFPFSELFKDFCENKFKEELQRTGIFGHPKFLKRSILYSVNHDKEIIKI